MKKISILLIAGTAVLATSCKKFLDINTNPNSATSTTPELIIPQALTGTAANLNQFNTYGEQLGGYAANAGGYGGFGTAISYNFTSADFSGLFSTSYDNLEDYQTILTATDANLPNYSYSNAAARIMKAMTFEMLVDTYNSVPYGDALTGSSKLTPTYADPVAVYKDLADELDKAIATINKGIATPGVALMGNSDVLFKGDMVKWKQLANTIKLRLVIFGAGKVTFSNTTFSTDGFLTTDALINPGYTRDNGRQNPKWDRWGYGYTGSDATKSWIPSTYILAFYNGTKLQDSLRGKAIYYQYPATGANQLGVESVSIPKCPAGSFWYPSTNRTGASAGSTTGVLKGPEAGLPVITAAESYFLQAEAALKGLIPGGADATLFKSGITASFKYLYAGPGAASVTTRDYTADANTYLADNATSPLVNYSQAATTAQKLEAIITQKYIAMNFVNSNVAWNDYRRTHYPTITGTSATSTFASSVSESSRPDKLPTRVLYPATEGAYNSANVPKGVSPFTSLIFWAL